MKYNKYYEIAAQVVATNLLEEPVCSTIKWSKQNTRKLKNKEVLQRDGTRVQVVLGIALMDNSQVNGVAFVLDISER
ncbi:hypothetical protein SD81_010460 [Tolypothrix campylonemoides VB511288]|nr:hypothetical protein SD81_010460 [Tolypothrix campylonemoides VB511288]